jgi:hypothetical protein
MRSITGRLWADKIYVNRLKDVKTETSVYSLEGKKLGTVDYDGIGSASGSGGRTTDRYGYFVSNRSFCRRRSTGWTR